MKKKVLMAIAVGILVAGSASAEWRVDVGADVPWGIGSVVSGFNGSSQSDVNVLKNFVFLVPEGNFLYQTPVGPFKLGGGIRAFTLVVETVAWPNAFAELDLGRVAVDLNVGGGAFLFFGLLNQLSTRAVVIPDLSAYVKLGRVFRVGGGGMIFKDFSQNAVTSGLPYLIYLSGKFSFTF